MKQAFATLIIASFSFLISCDDKLQSEKEVYVISKKDSIQNLSFKIEHDYYARCNFILGDSNKILFYRNGPMWICVPSKNKNPIFIDLRPDEITQLPVNSIEEFIELNFGGRYRRKYSICVASYTDSIKSKAFEKLINAFSKNRLPKYFIRRTTLEEEIVLHHKIEDLPYLPHEVEWDTTRINFTFEEDIGNILKKSQEKFKKS